MTNTVVLATIFHKELFDSKKFTLTERSAILAQLKLLNTSPKTYGKELKENIRYVTRKSREFDFTIYFSYLADNIIVALRAIKSIDMWQIRRSVKEAARRRNQIIRLPNKGNTKKL